MTTLGKLNTPNSMMKLPDFMWTRRHKHHQDSDNVATLKPEIAGLKGLTYAQMRKHKHTENPPCACHDIEAVLALVPEDQQGQFVRIYPCPRSRYANFPTGVSMIREEMDVEMTVLRQDSPQQLRRSLESMIMVPGNTARYTTNCDGGSEQEKKDAQFCVSQVASVLSSLYAQAVKAVRFEPAPEDKAASQPEEKVVIRIQRSNAVRYRNYSRPYARKDSGLMYHPGGEADSYYLPKHKRGVSPHEIADRANQAVRTVQLDKDAPEKALERTKCAVEARRELPARHLTCPDSPFPKPQQRTNPPGNQKNNPRIQQRHGVLPMSSPQPPTRTDKGTDECRPPPLRGASDLPSMTDMPGLPSPVQCDGYLRWPNLGTMDMPAGPVLASSSLSSNKRDVSPSAQTGALDGIPEAVPASRRFSLDEFSVTEAVPASDRFNISDNEYEVIGTERRSSMDSRFSLNSSSHEDDDEYDHDCHADANKESSGNNHVLSSCVSNLPSLGYYEYAVSSVPADPEDRNGVLERNLADNMDLYTYALDSPGSDTISIDQALFADFSGDFTGNGTSLPNSSSERSSTDVAPGPEYAVSATECAHHSSRLSTPRIHRARSHTDIRAAHPSWGQRVSRRGHASELNVDDDDDDADKQNANRALQFDRAKECSHSI